LGRRKRGWNAASGLSLADLRRLIDAKEAESARLAERRESIVAELADVEAQIAEGGAPRAKPGRKAKRRGPGRPRKAKATRAKRSPAKKTRAKRTRAKKTLGKRARAKRSGAKRPEGQSELHGLIRGALTGSPAPQKATEIAKKVVDSGYKTKSKLFHLVVGQRLAEMKDVKKPARGLYALA